MAKQNTLRLLYLYPREECLEKVVLSDMPARLQIVNCWCPQEDADQASFPVYFVKVEYQYPTWGRGLKYLKGIPNEKVKAMSLRM